MKNYMVVKEGDKWIVKSKDGGKVLGRHDDEESAKKQLAAIEASKARKRAMEAYGVEYSDDYVTIDDVDVFAVGTWRGVNSPPEGDKYEASDLDAMVEAFEAGVTAAHIKITHGDDKEQVDVGRVESLKRVGQKLFAKFNVVKPLAELMKKGLFKARSAEVQWGVQKGGKTWPRVLKAVALLAPGQRPAVSAISEGYQFEAIYCYALADSEDGYESQYINIINIREDKPMTVEALMKKYGARDEAHLEEILDKNLADLKEMTEKAEKVNEYEAERKQMREDQVKTFIEGLNKDGKVLPKHMEKFQSQLNALYEAGMEKEAEELKAVLSDMPKVVEFEEKSKDAKGSESTMGNPAAEVNRLGHELINKGEAKDYHAAMEVIQKKYPKLWKAYDRGDTEYKGEE